MPRKSLLGLLVLGVLPGTAAFGAGLELYPFVGYAVGGSFDARDVDAPSKLDDDAVFGLALDVPAGPGRQIELWYSRQETTLQIDTFGDAPITDVDLGYYHVGFVSYYPSEKVEPFNFFSFGVTTIDPQGPFDSENRLSLGVGGGARLFPRRGSRFGLRFTGRILGTYFDGSRRIFCTPEACLGTVSGSFLLQAQVEAGVTIRLD